jgi:hypothetical protein
MNNHPLLKYIAITSKNLLWQIGNSTTFGIPEALKNSTNEIYQQSKLSNEALYYLQVKTFLETLDIDENDIEQFMIEAPNNQRLGFEIFKILDSTTIEKQAEMLSTVFSLYVHKKISKQEFDKYTYIITSLNSYLILKIKELRNLYKLKIKENDFVFVPNQPLEFLNFGFIEKQLDPTFGDEETIKYFKNNEFLILKEFNNFYENIFKD